MDNLSIDRDLNAYINILEINVPVECREYMPMGTKTSTFIRGPSRSQREVVHYCTGIKIKNIVNKIGDRCTTDH